MIHGGSDGPVEDILPIEAMRAAIERRDGKVGDRNKKLPLEYTIDSSTKVYIFYFILQITSICSTRNILFPRYW